MSESSISDALFTKTQQRVLGLLYGQPDHSFYTNEIVRRADMGRGTVRRELDRLIGAGLLTVTHSGNQHHYQANSLNPIFSELKAIVRKTFGIADVIRSTIEPFVEQIELAFIYGSIAKGEETADSDIDLLVVGDALAYSELMGVLHSAREALGRPVNPFIYSKEELAEKIQRDNVFITRIIEQPKIWIKGEESDLGVFRQSGRYSSS